MNTLLNPATALLIVPLVAALVLVVFLVYQPAWHGGMIWDDDAHVTKPALRSLAGNPVARGLYTWRWSIVALWFTAVILMILVRFWNYWSTLI